MLLTMFSVSSRCRANGGKESRMMPCSQDIQGLTQTLANTQNRKIPLSCMEL
jgi:hypothetical protein